MGNVIARATGHLPSVANGADAVTYEIVPETYVVSLDANGDWVEGTTVGEHGGDSCAYVRCLFRKIVGSKRYVANGLTFRSSHVNGTVPSDGYVNIPVFSSDDSVTITLYVSSSDKEAAACCTITVNRAGANGTSTKIQFSKDGATWHDTYASGDVYMRVWNGTSWSAAIKFVGSNGTSFTPKGTASEHADKSSNIKFAFGTAIVDYEDRYNPLSSAPSVVVKDTTGVTATKATVGDAYVVESNIWVCTAEAWVNLGSIKGMDGESVYVDETSVSYGISASATDPSTVKAWQAKIVTVTDDKPYLWTKTYVHFSDGSDTTSYSVATRGNKGAVFRQHVGFVDGDYDYQSGSGTEEFIDAVKSDSGVWYRCIKSYNSTSTPAANNLSNAEYWSTSGMSNIQFIATMLLLAQDATINMMGANEINLYNGDARFGSFRVPHGTEGVDGDADEGRYALWLGDKTGRYAPFSVTNGGALRSTSGTIGGFTISKNNLHAEKDEMTFDIYNDRIVFVDNNNYRTVMIANDENEGLNVSLSERENNRMCKMSVGDDIDGNKSRIGVYASSDGYKSYYTQKGFYVGDYFGNRCIQTSVLPGSFINRLGAPSAGINCFLNKDKDEMSLFLAGLPSSTTRIGQVYVDKNGFLKIKL